MQTVLAVSYVRGGVIDALALMSVFFGWHWWRCARDVRCAEVTLALETRVTYGTMNIKINMRLFIQYTGYVSIDVLHA